MSQKKNSEREFLVNLWSDDDDYLDFGSDDDFDNMEQVHELSLAELLDRDERRRQDREQREREERQARRTQTHRKIQLPIQVISLILCYLYLFMSSLFFVHSCCLSRASYHKVQVYYLQNYL